MASLLPDLPLLANSEFLLTIIVVSSSIAVCYKRLTGHTPGGIVSIGVTLILLLKSPFWALICFLLSFPTFWFYRLVVSRIDRNGRFPYVYIFTLVTMAFGLLLVPFLKYVFFANVAIVAVGGLVVPAILANQYRLNGYSTALLGYSICIAMSMLFVFCILSISNSFGWADNLFSIFSVDHQQENTRYLLFVPFASIVSLVMGLFVYGRFGLRSGGFVMAPFAAQLLTAPVTATVLVSGCIVLYLFQSFLTRYTFIIGLQRYLANLTLAAVFVAFSIRLLQDSLGVYDARYLGSAWIVALVLAAYSSDLYIYRARNSWFFIAVNTFVAYIAFVLEGKLYGLFA